VAAINADDGASLDVNSSSVIWLRGPLTRESST
jgi:hypothetical protein